MQHGIDYLIIIVCLLYLFGGSKSVLIFGIVAVFLNKQFYFF